MARLNNTIEIDAERVIKVAKEAINTVALRAAITGLVVGTISGALAMWVLMV